MKDEGKCLKINVQQPRIGVNMTRKYNLGNYESADLNLGFSRDVASDEDYDEVFKDIQDMIVIELQKFEKKLGLKKGGGK